MCVFCDPQISSGIQKIGIPTKRRIYNPIAQLPQTEAAAGGSLPAGISAETSNSVTFFERESR